jgi:kynurenine formamidase
MPVFPGTPQPALTPALTIAEHGFSETMLQMMSHTGTHIDAPSHMIALAPNLDDFAADKFCGPALIIAHPPTAGKRIELKALQQIEDAIKRAEFVLFDTGHSKKWGATEYFGPYPILTKEAAEFLASFPLKGVGVDAISFDELDAAESPIHHILLGAGFVLIENLTNLQQAPAAGCLFAALPLKYRHADGSPVRAVAIEM